MAVVNRVQVLNVASEYEEDLHRGASSASAGSSSQRRSSSPVSTIEGLRGGPVPDKEIEPFDPSSKQ